MSGIFQGSTLLPLLIFVCILPLFKVLRKMFMGYMLGRVKVNNLVFMGDLRTFAESEKEIECFMATV